MKNSIFDRFGSKDAAERYIEALNEGCNLVIGACHEFAIVAKKFDGKKYNRRFINAVNEALLARFGAHILSNGLTPNKISLHLDESSPCDLRFVWSLAVRDVNLGSDAFPTTAYFDKDIFGDIYLNLDENGRIDVKHFETNARIAAQRVLETQTRYLDAIKFYDKYAKILNDIDSYIYSKIKDVNCLCVRSQMQYFNTSGSPSHDSKR